MAKGEFANPVIVKDPDLAEQVQVFRKSVDFIKQNEDELRKQYPGEMIIVHGEKVVAHGRVGGTVREVGEQLDKLWQQIDAAGLHRGSTHSHFLGEGTLADIITFEQD